MATTKYIVLAAIIMLSALIVAKADPTCRTYGYNSVVCSPGDTDYVLKKGLVSGNKVTTSITLKGCRITDIDKGAFKDLYSLKYLDLSRNMISNITLNEHLDENLPSLLHLNLSYNMLTILNGGALPVSHLEVLDLRGNKLTDINGGSLVDVQDLRFVDISDNNLVVSKLHVVLFMFTGKMRFFDMSGNDASVLETMRGSFLYWGGKLQVLHLDRCNISGVSNTTFDPLKAVKHLTLIMNRFDKIETMTFQPLISLEILDLSDNVIATIHDGAFIANTHLKTIILRKNRIKEISEDVFRALPILTNLDMSHNLIEDVSVGSFLATPLRNLNLANNRFTYLPEHFCLELRNSRASLRKFYFNQNPWQCACLKDILAEVKSFGIEYNSAKYDGKEPVCGVRKQFICERQRAVHELYVEIYDQAVHQYYLSSLGIKSMLIV